MIIYAVRHGQAEHNVAHVFNERDNPISRLTPKGIAQAESVAVELAQKEIKALYSSPIKRAQETAQIIGKRLGKSIQTDARLSEHQHGYHQQATWKWVARYVLSGLSTSKVFGREGQSLDSSLARIADFLDELKAQDGEHVVCIVAHKHTLQALDHIICGKSYRIGVLLPRAKASFTRYNY